MHSSNRGGRACECRRGLVEQAYDLVVAQLTEVSIVRANGMESFRRMQADEVVDERTQLAQSLLSGDRHLGDSGAVPRLRGLRR